MSLYFEVSEHDLKDARPGLVLVEQLMSAEHFEPFLYGLTAKPDVLLAAQAALEEDAGDEIAATTLGEIAVALPFTSDILLALSGSGVMLVNEEFAYLAPDEGSRSLSLRWGQQRPKVRQTDFTVMAIADSDMYLDDFLNKYAKTPSQGGEVERSPGSAVQDLAQRGPRGTIKTSNAIDRFLRH